MVLTLQGCMNGYLHTCLDLQLGKLCFKLCLLGSRLLFFTVGGKVAGKDGGEVVEVVVGALVEKPR